MLNNLIENLHCFCASATSDRDDSHGVVHMDIVREHSMVIWNTEKSRHPEFNCERIERLIVAAAQLHDVADHKYGKTEKQLDSIRTELLKYFTEEDCTLVMEIVDNVSFSKECKARKAGVVPNWDQLLGKEGALVRNIVSDADKLEAIGIIGVERCMQYTTEKRREKGLEVTPTILVERLIEHCNEKLFILMDKYIQTVAGKEMAEPRHREIVKEVERLQSLVDNNDLTMRDDKILRKFINF